MDHISGNRAPLNFSSTTEILFIENLSQGAEIHNFGNHINENDSNFTFRYAPKFDSSKIPNLSAWFDASELSSINTDISGKRVLG